MSHLKETHKKISQLRTPQHKDSSNKSMFRKVPSRFNSQSIEDSFLLPPSSHQEQKFIPNNIIYDKETLYYEVHELKQALNRAKQDNVKLKSRLRASESEKDHLSRSFQEAHSEEKDSHKQAIIRNDRNRKGDPKYYNLKKQVILLQAENKKLNQELRQIKKNIKHLQISQVQLENKVLIEENDHLAIKNKQLQQQIIQNKQQLQQFRERQKFIKQIIKQNKIHKSQIENMHIEIMNLQSQLKKTKNRQIKEKKLQALNLHDKKKYTRSHTEMAQTRKQPVVKPITFRGRRDQKIRHTSFKTQHLRVRPLRTENIQTPRQDRGDKQENSIYSIREETNDKKEQRVMEDKEIQTEEQDNFEQEQNCPVPKPSISNRIQQDIEKQPEGGSIRYMEKVQETTGKEENKEQMKEIVTNQVSIFPEGDNGQLKEEKQDAEQEIPQKQQQTNNNFLQTEKRIEGPQPEPSTVSLKQYQSQKPHPITFSSLEQFSVPKKYSIARPNQPLISPPAITKALLKEIRILLTYRFKYQKYTFEDLKNDIKSSKTGNFNYIDICYMLVNEPFFFNVGLSKIIITFIFDKERPKSTETITSTDLIHKLRKIVDDFEPITIAAEQILAQKCAKTIQQHSTILSNLMMLASTATNPPTIPLSKIVEILSKCQLTIAEIQFLIAETSIHSEDLEHINFGIIFERFTSESISENSQQEVIAEQYDEQNTYTSKSNFNKTPIEPRTPTRTPRKSNQKFKEEERQGTSNLPNEQLSKIQPQQVNQLQGEPQTLKPNQSI